MKTPRDILIEKHADLELRLDAIRRHVLQGETGAASCRRARPAWLETLWQQLVLPCRRPLAGLGVAWALILVLQGLANDRLALPRVSSPKLTTDVLVQLKEQWRLRTELLGPAVAEHTRMPGLLEPHSGLQPGRTEAVRREETQIV
jgi:hypothetical protein